MFNGVNGINNIVNEANYNQKNNAAINPAQSFDELFRAATYREIATPADVKAAIKSMGLALTFRAVPNNHDAVIANARDVCGQFGGSNSLTIAPNILEKMANDSDVRNYYFDRIQQWQRDVPDLLNRTPIHGGRVTNVTMTIHPDGTVSYVIFGQAPHEIDGEDEIYTQRADSYSQQTNIVAEYLPTANIPNKVEFDQITASKMGSMMSSDVFVKIFQTANK